MRLSSVSVVKRCLVPNLPPFWSISKARSPSSIDREFISLSKTDIRGQNLPNGILKQWDKFYVDLVINEVSEYTTGLAKGSTASWKDNPSL